MRVLQGIKVLIRDIGLKNKLIIIYTLFTIIFVVSIGLINYTISRSKLEEAEKKVLQNKITQTRSLIDYNFEMYYRKSEAIFANTTLQTAISSNFKNFDINQILYVYQEQIYKIILPIMQDILISDSESKLSSKSKGLYNTMVRIYSFNESLPRDGGIIHDYNDIKTEEWVQETLNLYGKIYWRDVFLEKEISYVSLNRTLKSFNTLKGIGILSIILPKTQIEYLLSESNENSFIDIYLIDSNNNIIRSNNSNNYIKDEEIIKLSEVKGDDFNIDEYSYNNEKYLYANITSNITEWKLVALFPYSSISESLKPLKYTSIIVLLIGIILSVIITILIAYFNTKRLERIIKKINILKTDRNAKLDIIYGKDEVGQLDQAFNEMIISFNTLVDKEKTLEMQRAHLQLELLQSQINPHILYNTLATISWQSKKEGALSICEIIDKLIRFFKYYLNQGKSMTIMGKEIEMIEYYIEILRFTYKMDFKASIMIDEEIYSYRTLNLLLQPIVENALIHGIRPLNRPGNLEITGSIRDNVIVMRIKDDGTGIDSETLNKLNNGEQTSSTGGYGLVNVSKRIKLYFGEAFGVEIHSNDNHGTEVIVRVPVLSEEELGMRISKV